MSVSTIITAEDLRAAASPEGFAQNAVERHMQSEMYRNAVDADEYYRQRNVTISRFTRRIFSATGEAADDFTASRLRIASNLFKRLNVQRCMYSLGKGVSFVDCKDESGEDTTEWPDARTEITRVRGGKLKVSDAYRGLLTADLKKITADYEASPDTYVENRAASEELLAQACRVEWIEE